MVIYIFAKFHENILDGIKVMERSYGADMIYIAKISKGHDSIKM